MHESDAMEFIETVYCRFVLKNYEPKELKDQDVELCLAAIRMFITDDCGHWVKEKALGIIEILVDCKDFFPTFPPNVLVCTRKILEKVADDIAREVEQTGGRVRASLPSPALEVPALLTHHQKASLASGRASRS